MATDPWSWDDVYGAPQPELPEDEDRLAPPPFNWGAAAKALGMGVMEGISAPGQLINESLGKGLHAMGSPSSQPFSSQAAEAFSPGEGYARSVMKPFVGTAFQMALDPVSYGALGVLKKLGGVGAGLQTLISAGFAGTMGHAGYQAAKAAAAEVEKRGYTPEAIEEITQSLLDFGFAGMAAKHAGGELNRLRPSVKQAAAKAQVEADAQRAAAEAAAIKPLQPENMPGVQQPGSYAEAAALQEAYKATVPDTSVLNPQVDSIVQGMANEILETANRLTAARAHPALRAPGEGYVGPQRVELAGEVNPIDGQPWQPGQKAEVSPDGSTIYLSPYGRAWAVQAPDAAGVQAKLVDLLSHEVQHPAQAFGQPAARNTLVPASPEHAAATGDQWVTSEIQGEAPVPGHATTGTWYDDRLADLKMRQGETVLAQALKRHKALQATAARVQASGRLGEIYRPAGPETAIAGTYDPYTLSAAAESGLAPKVGIMEAADVGEGPTTMRMEPPPGVEAPALAAGGSRSKASVWRNPRDPRVKQAMSVDEARRELVNAEDVISKGRAVLAETQPKGPEAQAAAPAPEALDPVSRAILDRQRQRAALPVAPSIAQRIRDLPFIGALLGRKVQAPAPAAAPVHPDIGVDLRGRTRGEARYAGDAGIERLKEIHDNITSGRWAELHQAAMEGRGLPMGWLKRFNDAYYQSVAAHKASGKPLPEKYTQHKARIDALITKLGSTRSFAPKRMTTKPGTYAKQVARSEANVEGKPQQHPAEARALEAMGRQRDAATRIEEAKKLSTALNQATNPADVRRLLGSLRETVGGIDIAKLGDAEQIRAVIDYHKQIADRFAKLASQGTQVAQPKAAAPAPGGGAKAAALRRFTRKGAGAEPRKGLRERLEESLGTKGYKLPKWAESARAALSATGRFAASKKPIPPVALERSQLAALPQVSSAKEGGQKLGPRALAGLIRRLGYSAELPPEEVRPTAPPASPAKPKKAGISAERFRALWERAKRMAARKGSGVLERSTGQPVRTLEAQRKMESKAKSAFAAYWKRVDAGRTLSPERMAHPQGVAKGVQPEDLKRAVAWAKEKGNLRDYPDWMLEEAAKESYSRVGGPEYKARAGEPLAEVEYELPQRDKATGQLEAPKPYTGAIRVKGREISISQSSGLAKLRDYLAAPRWSAVKQGFASADSTAAAKLFGEAGREVAGHQLQGTPGLIESEGRLSPELIRKAGFSDATEARLLNAFNSIYKRLRTGKLRGEIKFEVDGKTITMNNPEIRAQIAFQRVAERIIRTHGMGDKKAAPWATTRSEGQLVEPGKPRHQLLANLNEALNKGLKLESLKTLGTREVPTRIPWGSRATKVETFRRWETTEEFQKRGGQKYVDEQLHGRTQATKVALAELGIEVVPDVKYAELRETLGKDFDDYAVIPESEALKIFERHNTRSATSGKRQNFSPFDIVRGYSAELKQNLGQMIDIAKWARGEIKMPDHVAKAARDRVRYDRLASLPEAKHQQLANEVARQLERDGNLELANKVRLSSPRPGKGKTFFSQQQLLDLLPKGMTLEEAKKAGLGYDFDKIRNTLAKAKAWDNRLLREVNEKGQPFELTEAEQAAGVEGAKERATLSRNRLGTEVQGATLDTTFQRLRFSNTLEYPEFQAAGGRVARGSVPDLLDLLKPKRAFPTGGRKGGKAPTFDEEQAKAELAEGTVAMRRTAADSSTQVGSTGFETAVGKKPEIIEKMGSGRSIERTNVETGKGGKSKFAEGVEAEAAELGRVGASQVGMGGYTGAKKLGGAGVLEGRAITPPRPSQGPSHRLSPPPLEKPKPETAGWSPAERKARRSPKHPSGAWYTTSRTRKGAEPLSFSKYKAQLPDLMRAKGMEPTGEVSQAVRKPSFMKAAGAAKRKTFSLPALPPELEASVNTPKSALPLHSKGEASALELLHTVGKYANITRPILTSIDVSNPFRQTWQLTSDQITKDLSKVFASKYRGEDTSAYRNVRDMVKAWASEDFYQKAKAELEQDQWYIAGKEKGLNYASREHPNEAYVGKDKLELFLKKTGLEKAGWVIKASERSFEYYQNKAMRDSFKAYVEALETYKKAKTPGEKLSEDEIIDAVRHINNAASRGKVTSSQQLNEMANYFVYSAQMNASRLRMLFSAGGTLNSSTAASRYVAGTQTLRAIAGAAAVTGAVYGVGKLLAPWTGQDPEVEANPLSTDWGKVRWGNTTFDAWGGNQQFLRVAAQSLVGKQKERSTGLLKDRKLGDTLATFVRSKLGPGASTAWSILDKRTLAGESTDVFGLDAPNRTQAAATLIKELVTPMSVADTVDLWKENPKLAWLVPLMLMGEGLGAGGGAKEAWLEDRSAGEILAGKPSQLREMDRANAKELRRMGVTPPRLSGKVSLPGKDPYGRKNYYNLTLAEKQEFESEYMPLVTKLLNEFVNSETYQRLPDTKKRKRLYRFVHKLNVTYGASKKARAKFKGMKPSNRPPSLTPAEEEEAS